MSEQDEAIRAAAKAMQAHENWSKPGYEITLDELETANQRYALIEAIEYLKEHDPDYLKARLQLELEGVRE